MKFKRFFSIVSLVLLVLAIIVFCYFFVGKANPVEKIDFGITFSKIYAEQLGLDWQEAYLSILDDLNVRKIRLIAYWSEIEPSQGDFDFEDLDWQIKEAEEREMEIILAVGQRLPRWPECHVPEWAETQDLLGYLEKTINRYKDREAIKFWQIENEPFLGTFGECPKLDKKFLDQEIALARNLDPTRKIIITESGEFSVWIGAARRGDILGTTLYRKIYGKLGYVRYPIPAIFYQRKTALIKKFFNIDKIIVIELQAEPWGPDQNWKISLEEQFKSMNAEEFRKIIDYTKRAGFSEAYLWGAEWWYWLKQTYGDDSMWEEAKKICI